MPTAGNPVVYGEKIIDPSKPTVLVYGHYDVMPVDPIELWTSPPFEPEIRDGKIWARGADDDKGQAFMHAKAFEFMVKNDKLPCNVKFMIEGEEEIGSVNLGQFCDDNKELLKADIILVSDTGMIAADVPTITTGLRGLAYWQVEVTGPNRDLHSGLFGGAVANPINVLAKMITDMVDDQNKITIPGFYDDVLEASAEERAKLAEAPFDEEEYKKAIDVKALKGEAGYTPSEHTGIRPSFDVCGIWGGYTGEGAKTVLPSKAYAKISSRLVPDQNHEKIAEMFKQHFEGIAPDYVKVEVESLHGVEELLKLKPETDVILLDDAFQHRAIKPGFSILLTDYHKPYYKDYILPTGTLRESVAGANRADIIIVTKSPKVLSPLVKRYFEEKLKPLPHQKLYFSYIKYAKLKPFSTIAQALEKKCKINTILLFAGIANTYPLEDYLKKMCNNLELVSYSDHYNYQEKDLLQIENTFNHLLTKDKIIVTTEKDAMRLKEKSLKKIIDRLPVYYIPIKVTLHDNAEDEFNKLVTDYVEENKRNR
jgi:acetylornithine deacetylase/succinyl-diaminopimelate desuccinylase-like protein